MSKKIETTQSASGLTRREVLATGVAAGALATGLPLGLGSAYAATPKKGGTLRLGIGHGSTTRQPSRTCTCRPSAPPATTS